MHTLQVAASRAERTFVAGQVTEESGPGSASYSHLVHTPSTPYSHPIHTLQVTASRAERTFAAGQVTEESGLGSTSSAYMHRSPSTAWSQADTDAFFEALRVHGTDFTLIAAQFPNRNRRQIKNKFKREEKEHSQVLFLCQLLLHTTTTDAALAHARPFLVLLSYAHPPLLMPTFDPSSLCRSLAVCPPLFHPDRRPRAPSPC
jgi:hypothetical protein